MGASETASAQTSIGAAVGVAVPVGGTADALEIGDHAGAFVAFRPPRYFKRARLDLTWSNLRDRNAPWTHRFFWTTLNVVLQQPGVAEPTGYVILGAGLFHQTRSGSRRDALGLSAGAGIDFSLGPFGAFAEARVHYVDDGLRTKLFPIGLGLRF